MADNTNPQAVTSPGGTVEPANRASVAKELFQTPRDDLRRERFELRDPFADVTYRSAVVTEIIAKAEQLGSDRFTAIAQDGRRSVIKRLGGEWRRGPQLPALAERPLDPLPVRDEATDASPSILRAGTAAHVQSAKADPAAIAKLDANADRAAMVARLELGLKERYVIKRARLTAGDVPIGRTEYRFRADTSRIAFTESTFRLTTETNNPSVARSMVDVAQARNWKGLRVSGSEEFRRLVWLEASVRGVKAIGYEPNPADLDVLKRERDLRQANRIEPARDSGESATTTGGEKASNRGGSGRKAVVAAIEAVLTANRVPEAKRTAVLAAVAEKLAQRKVGEQAPRVKVYDINAPAQRVSPVITPDKARSQDRAAPVHAR